MVCGQDTSAEARVCAPAYAHACVCVCQDGSHGGQDRVLRHPDAMPRKAPFYADIVRSDSPARAARATSAWGGAARHPHAGVARALWDAAGAPLCRLLQSLPAFRPLLHRTFFTLIAASILAGAHSLSNVQRKHARTHLFSVNLLPSLSHFLIVKKPSLSLSLSLSRVRFLARSLLFILSLPSVNS
jgi:hypothetical protein